MMHDESPPCSAIRRLTVLAFWPKFMDAKSGESFVMVPIARDSMHTEAGGQVQEESSSQN